MTFEIKLRALGFSLVEMAVVLVIVGLLIGSMVMPLTAQRDLQDKMSTQSSLDVIVEAIYGFTILKGRLPCPTNESDPSSAGYGVEDCTITTEGFLPWKTLGVDEADAWASRRVATTDSWAGYWRYRVDTNFDDETNFDTYILATTATYASSLQIQDSDGNTISSTVERPIAIVFSTGTDMTANGENASTGNNLYESNSETATFDDMLIWITRPVLVNRMVAAGKLP